MCCWDRATCAGRIRVSVGWEVNHSLGILSRLGGVPGGGNWRERVAVGMDPHVLAEIRGCSWIGGVWGFPGYNGRDGVARHKPNCPFDAIPVYAIYEWHQMDSLICVLQVELLCLQPNAVLDVLR